MPIILIIPLIAGLIAQIIKTFIISWKNKKFFDFKYLSRYGGMPSAHATFLASLATAIYLKEGIDSTSLAVTIIIAVIIIRDAFGFRMILENQGKTLKEMIQKNGDQFKDLENNYKFKTLGYKIGHSVPELIAGTILGIVIAIGLYFLL